MTPEEARKNLLRRVQRNGWSGTIAEYEATQSIIAELERLTQENARLREALAGVTFDNPWWNDAAHGRNYCGWCYVGDSDPHASDCVWVAAQEALK